MNDIRSVIFNEFVKLFDIEVQHLIRNTFDMVLFELELYSQKTNFFLRKMDKLLQLHLHLVSFEIIANEYSVVKAIHHVFLEVFLQRRLCASYQG